jgi:hypothetical protein
MPPPGGSLIVRVLRQSSNGRDAHFAWADLLRRVFAIDNLACPDCGGRLRLLATIEDRAVVDQILTHLEPRGWRFDERWRVHGRPV